MTAPKTITPTHRYRNNDTAVGVGNDFLEMSEQNGLAGIVGGTWRRQAAHRRRA